MDLMRSEKMQLVQLIIPVESAHLGDLGLLQFKDIKQCGEMARKLHFYCEIMIKAGLSSAPKLALHCNINIDDLEIKLDELEAELVEIIANNEKLQSTNNELMEYKVVLHKVGEFFYSARSTASAHYREIESKQLFTESIDCPLLVEQIKLDFMTGIVPKDKSMAFERILLRAMRMCILGKLLLKNL